MTIFEVVILFFVFLKYSISSSMSSDVEVPHHTNDGLFTILDDLFISLRINNDLINTRTADEYTSSHSFIQEAIWNNHKKYKQIRDMSKTKYNHKIAYYISNINDVIGEMIRREAAILNVESRNESIANAATDGNLKHFINLARTFNLRIKTFTPNIPNLSGLKTHSSEDARRIFEGSSTGIKRYPFMVSVHVASRFICAGSLLHESLAISAASCLEQTEDSQPIQIRVGSDFVSKMGAMVNVNEVIVHPEFDRATLANNLVLLRTRKALRFRPQRVVAIQYDREGESVPRAGDILILGWGRRRTDENDLPQEERPLSQSRLEVYNFEACKYIYTSEYVTDKTFCAGFEDRGAGACNHDGGGPALTANVLTGVISFGSPRCGRADAPTVFTRVALYADWIDNVFEKLAKTPEGQPLEPQLNIPRQPADMQDVYKQNINVEDILYGPIEMTEGDYVDLFNKSTKQQLRELADNPSLSDPKILANMSPKTPEPIVPPEGYWRDISMERNSDNFRDIEDNDSERTTNVESTSPILSETNDSEADAFENIEIAIPNTTEANQEEPFYGVGSTEVETIESSCDDSAERFEKPGDVATQPNSGVSQPVTHVTQMYQSDLNEENETISNAKQSEIEIENAKENELEDVKENMLENTKENKLQKVTDKAVIIMYDSGTTRRLEVDKSNPVYERGFKILAAKLDKDRRN